MGPKWIEERGKTETTLDTGYRSDNERTKIGGRGQGGKSWLKSSNKFLKRVQENVQDVVKPDK